MSKRLLEHVDSDDVDEAIREIVKSLGIETRPEDSSLRIKTFGEFCTVIYSRLEGKDIDDCTTQQAFYKLRGQIAQLLNIESSAITPASRLEELFPREGRRVLIRQLRKSLDISMYFLEPKLWISLALLFGFLSAIVTLFFNWRYGLTSLGISLLGFRLAGYFGKEFNMATVGEAAKEMSRMHYVKSRRDPHTLNSREVDALIRECLCDRLALDPEVLTEDARFR